MKRLNPYQYLLQAVKQFCATIPQETIDMFYYEKAQLRSGYNLEQLYERTQAAQQLSYEVLLRATEKGLEIKYRKALPTVPWDWR